MQGSGQRQFGDAGSSGQQFSLPAVAGEEEHLLVLGEFLEQVQSLTQALVVKGGQGVVQDDGGLFRQTQIANPESPI